MRWALLFLVLTTSALGQVPPKRVPTEEAERHLVGNIQPSYPPLAERTQISGVVLLEISIDENGKPQLLAVLSGHPLLAQAAMDAVKDWRFQPFLEDGKPSIVVTDLVVPFATSGRQIRMAREQLEVRYHFWTAENFAQAALSKGDTAEAAAQLKEAEEYVHATKGDVEHAKELLQLAVDFGDLSTALQKYDEAEQMYRKALVPLQKGNSDAPELAAVFEKLGVLYVQEKRNDLARDNFDHSVVVYQKNFRKTSSGDWRRQFYGQKIVRESYVLFQLSLSQPEAIKNCQRVIDFQNFLDTVSHDRVVATCQKAINEP